MSRYGTDRDTDPGIGAHSMAQHGTAQHSTGQHSTVQCSAVQCSIIYGVVELCSANKHG